MSYSVFISHSNEQHDWDRVRDLEQWLLGIGIKPLLARRSYEPEPAATKIQKMIGESDAMLVFLTQNSSKSGFVNQEIGYASGKIPVVVLRDPDIPMTGFVYGFDTIEMGTEKGVENVEKLRKYLVQQKTSKEVADSIISGLIGFALGAGLVLLFLAAKK